MTRILDVLEEFLDLRSYNYVRFDGSTKPDDRFVLVCLIVIKLKMLVLFLIYLRNSYILKLLKLRTKIN